MTVSVARAPGRLDLMGGVGDYSGALVLQVPTSLGITVRALPSNRLVVGPVECTRGEVVELATLEYPSLRLALAEVPRWTLYLLGVVLVLLRHHVIRPEAVEVELQVNSDLPRSVGVSSSAALEVATAKALTTGAPPARQVDLLTLALLCQEAENEVVGVPCGAMDQIAVALGEPGAVLPILCRPGQAGLALNLPAGLEVVGWPTGAEHDVGGLPYRRARTAAFMGKHMVESATDRRYRWIADLPADQLCRLPESISGAVYLDRWGFSNQSVAVDGAVDYPVRAAATFGSMEDQRSRALLRALRRSDVSPIRGLFAASHAGYDSMGLGHGTADSIVAQALDRPSVHGARSSGGGSGGTVVVLCDRGALDDVEGIIR